MALAQIKGVPRVVPVVQLGTGDSRGGGDGGLWGRTEAPAITNARWSGGDVPEDTWNGHEPYFVDITCNVHEAETFTGHERTTDQWDIGTATVVLDNRSGWADFPPTIDDTPISVRPGRHVRVGVIIDGNEPSWLWRGYVDQANPGYDVERGEVVVLECVDAKGEAGRGEIAKVDPAVGASETITARIGRLLTANAWPSYWRNLDASAIDVVATPLGQQAIDLLNRAADSGGGALFGDIDGKVRYRNRDWQQFEADIPPDGTIGNEGGDSGYSFLPLDEDPDGSLMIVPPSTLTESPASSGLYTAASVEGYDAVEDPPGSQLFGWGRWVEGSYCPTGWELSFARADFANRVIIGRSDMDEPITVDDTDNVLIYGAEPFTLTDLDTELDSELTSLANRLLATRGFGVWDPSDPESHSNAPRIVAVTLNAATDRSIVDLLSTADPRQANRYICRHRGTDQRMIFNRTMFCTGIRHTITPDLWEARLTLDDAHPWVLSADSGRWTTTAVWGRANPSLLRSVWSQIPKPA